MLWPFWFSAFIKECGIQQFFTWFFCWDEQAITSCSWIRQLFNENFDSNEIFSICHFWSSQTFTFYVPPFSKSEHRFHPEPENPRIKRWFWQTFLTGSRRVWFAGKHPVHMGSKILFLYQHVPIQYRIMCINTDFTGARSWVILFHKMMRPFGGVWKLME